jgi:integrase
VDLRCAGVKASRKDPVDHSAICKKGVGCRSGVLTPKGVLKTGASDPLRDVPGRYIHIQVAGKYDRRVHFVALGIAQHLTRSGFKHIVNKHFPAAVNKCPSLKTKRVSPHVLRHTCALNTLQATGDIRKVALWLGHESIQSTEIYLRVDPSQKREMLEAVLPPTLKRGYFPPADKLIASFRGK